MAKLVLFLFVAVCVVAVQMAPADSSDDDQWELPVPDSATLVEERFNIPWKKGWEIAKPILKDAGKAAGKEIIKGITKP